MLVVAQGGEQGAEAGGELVVAQGEVRRQSGRQVGGDGEQAAAAGDRIDQAGQEDRRQHDQENVQRGFHQRAEGAA